MQRAGAFVWQKEAGLWLDAAVTSLYVHLRAAAVRTAIVPWAELALLPALLVWRDWGWGEG